MSLPSPEELSVWEEWKRSGELRVVYQPIVDLQSASLVGYEALSRFYLQEEVCLSPDRAFDIARVGGDGTWLDLVVLKTLTEAIHTSPQVLGATLFVNLLPFSLIEDFDTVLDLLKTFPQMHHLVIEIAERENLPSDLDWSGLLQPIRDLGIKIALDDVGSGYSSLARIVEIQPDWIKLDRQLIADIDHSLSKRAMSKAIVQFAKETGIRVLAEGVEREEEASVVLQLGIRDGQGYWWAKPGDAPVWPLPRLLPEVRDHATPYLSDWLQSWLMDRTDWQEWTWTQIAQAASTITAVDTVWGWIYDQGIYKPLTEDLPMLSASEIEDIHRMLIRGKWVITPSPEALPGATTLWIPLYQHRQLLGVLTWVWDTPQVVPTTDIGLMQFVAIIASQSRLWQRSTELAPDLMPVYHTLKAWETWISLPHETGHLWSDVMRFFEGTPGIQYLQCQWGSHPEECRVTGTWSASASPTDWPVPLSMLDQVQSLVWRTHTLQFITVHPPQHPRMAVVVAPWLVDGVIRGCLTAILDPETETHMTELLTQFDHFTRLSGGWLYYTLLNERIFDQMHGFQMLGQAQRHSPRPVDGQWMEWLKPLGIAVFGPDVTLSVIEGAVSEDSGVCQVQNDVWELRCTQHDLIIHVHDPAHVATLDLLQELRDMVDHVS